MRREISVGAEHAALRAQFGEATFLRGLRYAREDRVLEIGWGRVGHTLLGRVRGTGAVYTAQIDFLSATGSGELALRATSCTCPVGVGCKHAVAVLLSVFADVEEDPEPAPARPHWADVLAEVAGSVAVERGGRVALGLSLALTGAARKRHAEPELGLSARLVRPGKKGWIAGDLAWNRLDGLPRGYEYCPRQVRLLRELNALHEASSAAYSSYYYSYNSAQRDIDLAEVESRALWTVLADAAAAGVRLIHAGTGQAEIDPPVAAELSIDVGACPDSAEGLAVRPVLRVGGEPVSEVPVLFAAGGHGAVLVDPSALASCADPARWPIRLVSLAEAVPPALHSWARSTSPLTVPAGDVERFRTEFVPQLRTLAPLTSADGSFVPPVVSAPTLLLRASFGDGHALDLDWAWAYEVDGERHEIEGTGVASPFAERFRDPALEAAALAALEAEVPQAFPGTARALRGLDTMRFHTEIMPLLRDRDDCEIAVTGFVADYHEAGDAVAISVTADERPGDQDWFDLGITVQVEDHEVPFRDLFVAISRGETHLLLPDGAYFSLDKPALVTLRRLISEAQALQEKPDEPLRISRYQAGLWDELVELGVIERQAASWRRQVEGLLGLAALPLPPAPSGLTATLRPYQAAGVGWLCFLWQHGLGGVLADDMGLGKTVQTLGMLCHARATAPDAPPFLIVAPTSVVPNWPAEAARFAPGLRVVTVSDTLRRSGRTLDEWAAGADVVVTSYTLLRLDIEQWAGREWSGLLLDEAQMVKNHQAKVHACARQVPAPFKLAITGTPMENNLMELWSMFSITAPGLFPSPQRFKDFYVRPIEARGRVETASGRLPSSPAVSGRLSGSPAVSGRLPSSPAASGAERLAALRRRVRPLMLRRTKEQVAPELPAKQEQVLEIALHPRHRAIYDRCLARERSKILGLLADMDRNRFEIFRSLTLLRRLSLHAGLVDDEHAEVPSAKIESLLEHLREVAEGGHRALVFSQFTGFLGLLRERLAAEGIEYCYLDGQTRRRSAVIEEFKSGTAPAFLISLKAGGFGLNLTEADYCFLLDPWWNPAAESQAVDRTHRIGQARTVMVYRLLSADTIEAKVRALAARKAVLFADVMGDDGAEAFSRALSAEDVRSLFE